jgi:sarcosine oxidase delta subunit
LTAQGSQTGQWGRVDETGTVYVRIGDEEHAVGQYPEGSADEAMAFFTRRFDAIAFEVQLLEQRVRAGALTPDEATASIEKVSAQLAEPNAVGDYVSLIARLDALRPLVGLQREQRREDRARRLERARERKAEIVAEAERLAQGNDWRNGANRLRELLAEWKSLQRLDKGSDDELWHRFSGARTTYTRRRKTHFAEMSEKREAARVVKERLVREAEALADSTDWGATSAAYRALMQQWKAAGPAPKSAEDELWKRFRGAQDTFFGARDAANAKQDAEFAANAEKKRALLVEAEALLPVTDLDAAKRAFRDIAERWDAAGKVPRDQVKPLESRIRKVEQAIRGVEDDQWRRSDPEKSARADEMVTKLRTAIADLESDLDRARARGDDKRVRELEDNLASRRAFLEMAEQTASEFSG